MIVWQASCVINPDEIDVEDSGTALITEIVDDNDVNDYGFFVRLHSSSELLKEGETWKTADGHSLFRSLIGKRINITVELDEEVRFDASPLADILIDKLTGKYGETYAKHYIVSALSGAHFAGMREMKEFYDSKKEK